MQSTTIQLILKAGYVVKGVLGLLVFFSVISWAIIIYKWRYFSVAKKESVNFLRYFKSSDDASMLDKMTRTFNVSPLANIFKALLAENNLSNPDDMRRTLRKHVTQESAKFERYLTFLATAGSTAPFIGLFGTVWGIMNAFQGIGAAGSASLVVVAPGIAEALIATAAGLAAAIPAVISYNYYLSVARRMAVEMEDFSEELIDFFSRSKERNEIRKK